jgi:hypothetical protein
MKLSPLTDIELIVLSHTSIRCLISNGILTKEDLMADLARQGIDADTAFRLKAALDQIPVN